MSHSGGDSPPLLLPIEGEATSSPTTSHNNNNNINNSNHSSSSRSGLGGTVELTPTSSAVSEMLGRPIVNSSRGLFTRLKEFNSTTQQQLTRINSTIGQQKATYDPLSHTQNGRVKYNVEIAEAMINTAQQLEIADRQRRRASASIINNNCNTQHGMHSIMYEDQHRGHSQRTVDLGATFSTPSSISETNIKPLHSSSVRRERKLIVSRVETPLSISPIKNNNDNNGSLALIPFDSIKNSHKRLSGTERVTNNNITTKPTTTNMIVQNNNSGSNGVYNRRGAEPVTWRTEHTFPNAHQKSSTTNKLICTTKGLNEEKSNRTSIKPTLHHKQLTEAFYGNYSGGILAKEAYLHFMADINKKRIGGEGNSSHRKGRKHKKTLPNSQQERVHSYNNLEGDDSSIWSTSETPQSKFF